MLHQRLAAQGLCGPPATSAVEVVTRLLAVQAQDPRGARLSVRSRSIGLSAADVDAALDAGSLVVTWLNRGTLHLVTPRDYWWLHPLTTPQLATGNARRLGQEGVSPADAERGVEIVAAAVQEGPQTRAALRARLEAAAVPTAGQALVHILVAASIRGAVVRGPMVGGEAAYVSVPQWLGPPPPALSQDEVQARLAQRYLVGHGPAGPADLAKWAGIGLGKARRGMAALGTQAVAVPTADGDGLFRLAGAGTPPPLPPPRLLGPFDPLLLGWTSRADLVGAHRGIVTTNGIIRPVALVGGRVVATWGLAGGVLAIRPLQPIAAGDVDALRGDGAAVFRFLGVPPGDTTVAG